jgi:hypothetical protein
MKFTTTRAIQHFLGLNFAALATSPLNQEDRQGKLILALLADHKLIDHPDLSPSQVKAMINEHQKLFIHSGSWKNSQDDIVLTLVLMLGHKQYSDITQIKFFKLQSLFDSSFVASQWTQPQIKLWLNKIDDQQQNYPFIGLLKGIYYALLQDEATSARYLKSYTQPEHRDIVTYYQTRIALRIKHIQDTQKVIPLLQSWNNPRLQIQNLLEEAQNLVQAYQNPDYFHDVPQCTNRKELDDYIERSFTQVIWKKMDRITKDMIKIAFYITNKTTRLFQEGHIEDYSSFALPFVKAYEYECYKLFFKDYIGYLKSKNISPFESLGRFKRIENMNKHPIVNVKKTPLEFLTTEYENFTLGGLSYIIGINHTLLEKDLKTVDPIGLEANKLFLEYWEKRTKNLTMLKGNGSLVTIAKTAYLLSKMRNKLTHAETFTFEELKQVVNILFEKGELRSIIQVGLN